MTEPTSKSIDPALLVALIGVVMPLIQALADGYQQTDLAVIGQQAARALKLALGDAAEDRVQAVGLKIDAVLDAVLHELAQEP